MSQNALPILIVNLGCEIIFVLCRRLRGLEGTNEYAVAIQEVVSAMLNPEFLKNLFEPQELYGVVPTRALFERLCHSAGIQIDEDNMSTLFGVAAMAFKYQILLSLTPAHLMNITLNHIDSLRPIFLGQVSVLKRLDAAHAMFVSELGMRSLGEWVLIRRTLLSFMQNRFTKVPAFVSAGLQSDDGRIILPQGGQLPPKATVPGTITYYEAGNREITRFFDYGQRFDTSNDAHDSMNAERGEAIESGTKLGENLYDKLLPKSKVFKGGPQERGNRISSGSSDIFGIRVGAVEPVWDIAPDETNPEGHESDNSPPIVPSQSQVAHSGLEMLSSMIRPSKSRPASNFTPNPLITGEMPKSVRIEQSKPERQAAEYKSKTSPELTKENSDISKIKAEFTGLDESFEGFGEDGLLDLMDNVGFKI